MLTQKSKSVNNKIQPNTNIVITVNNSMCKITGLDDRQFRELKTILSYPISRDAAFFGSAARFSNRRYLIDRAGNFPTGLLYLVDQFVQSRPILAQKKDQRFQPPKNAECENLDLKSTIYSRLGVSPRPEQIEAIKAAIRETRGIISMPTGTGKSLVAGGICLALGLPTLTVVPTLGIKKQLTADYKRLLGDDNVGGLGSKFAVENVDALDLKEELIGYHCVIIDEFHHSGARTYRALNKKAWKSIYYKFGLTATPFRTNDDERLLLESVLSQVIYRLSYREAVLKGYIVPVEAYYYDLPVVNINGYTWGEVYKESVVCRADRNQIISDIMTSLQRENKSQLCLVKEIEHGLALQSLCPTIEFVQGANDQNRQLILEFNLNERTGLIGTVGCLGEGIDTKPAEWIVIAGLGKSKGQLMQQIGRGVRQYPGKASCKVILFRDRSHKWTMSHFRAQCKLLRDEYGVIPVKL